MKTIREVAATDAIAESAIFEPSQEANHRIANNLALIASFARIQASRAERPADTTDPRDFGSLLLGLAANIDAVARLHRHLLQTPSQDSVDACMIIKELCIELKSAFSFSGLWTFACSFHSRCMLPSRHIIPISIIITELVTNAVKYAHPGGVPGILTIDVRSASDRSLVVEVMDDGVGFPEGFDIEAGGNIGLGVVRALVKDLHGTLSIEYDELGTVARLRVPQSALTLVAVTKDSPRLAQVSELAR